MIQRTLTALTLTAVLASSAFAAHGDGRKPARDGHRPPHAAGYGWPDAGADPERMVRHLGRKLSLSDAQQQAIENIVATAQPEIDALREQGRAQQEAMRALDVNDPNYASNLQNAATTAGDLASRTILLHGRLRADVDAQLTPGQRQQLRENRDDRHERWKKRRDDGA